MRRACLVAFLPIAVTAGWVLVAAQPNPNTYRDHVRLWDRQAGLADVVHYLMPFVPALAFGIGLVFGLTLLTGAAMVILRRETVVEEPAPVARGTAPATAGYRSYDGDVPATTTTTPVRNRYDAEAPTTAAPVVDGSAADEPTAAERAEAERIEADRADRVYTDRVETERRRRKRTALRKTVEQPAPAG